MERLRLCWSILVTKTPLIETLVCLTKHSWNQKIFKTVQPYDLLNHSSVANIFQFLLQVIWGMVFYGMVKHLLTWLRKLKKFFIWFNTFLTQWVYTAFSLILSMCAEKPLVWPDTEAVHRILSMTVANI